MTFLAVAGQKFMDLFEYNRLRFPVVPEYKDKVAIGANKCRIRKLDIIKDFLKQSPAERLQEFPEEPGRELHRHLRKH